MTNYSPRSCPERRRQSERSSRAGCSARRGRCSEATCGNNIPSGRPRKSTMSSFGESMEQHELLKHVASALDILKIPYFVTGSFAGILYGPFRMTNDLDVVIDLKRERVDDFLAAFPGKVFYVDRDAV